MAIGAGVFVVARLIRLYLQKKSNEIEDEDSPPVHGR
jgi:hypothetical protein